MANTLGEGRRAAASLGLAAVALLLATPLTAVAAERMVLGEYFTATW